MKLKRLLAMVLTACMLFAFTTACTETPPATGGDDVVTPGGGDDTTPGGGDDTTPGGGDDIGDIDTTQDVDAILNQLPRNETVFFNGLGWGSPNGWNGFSSDMNNPLAFNQESFGARVPMLETPYMYNPLDGSLMPLLADGAYSWNSDRTQLTFTIKAAATWSDGSPVTAHDFAFTFEAGQTYGAGAAGGFAAVIDWIEAVDDSTVTIHSKLTDAGQPVNPLMILSYLIQNHVLQKEWLEALIERNNGDNAAIAADPGDDIVFSGPYGPHFFTDSLTVLIRNDNYWGQDASMWGKLPAPKYLANPVFIDNAAGDVAFADGRIDVSQNFIANVHLMWEDRNLPISTYYANAPYNMAQNMPTAFYNMNNPIIADNVEIRRAIAWAVDYDLILANALTNQAPSFREVPRSLMNPTAGEQAMFNSAAVADLQWVGNEIDRANAYLDDAGILMGDSGWREIDGEPLSFVVSCPYGWSDWEAAMEIVAAAGAAIGIELVTNFPDWSVYSADVTSANQTDYDIFMMWTDGASPAQPWSRIRNLMSSEFAGNDGNWSGNWGQYRNDRVQELLAAIPVEADNARVVELYTELVEIYLTEVPSFSLMYRPATFHTVNETVWTGFTEAGDGRNVPPMVALSGYGIADLFNIRLVE